METIKELFADWELDMWADVSGIIGFLFAIGSFIIGLLIKSEINKLKTSYIFDKRITKHIKNLTHSASEINRLHNDYENSILEIRRELGLCITELEDLITKLSFNQKHKSKALIRFLKRRRNKTFVKQVPASPLWLFLSKYPKRIYQTSDNDIWIVYERLLEIIRQMENIKQNKDKAL